MSQRPGARRAPSSRPSRSWCRSSSAPSSAGPAAPAAHRWVAGRCSRSVLRLAFVINWVAFVPAYLLRTERFYDLTGTITYLSVVVVALVAGSGSALSILLAVLIAVWGLRLGTFLVLRIRKDGSDGRFDEIKVDPARFLDELDAPGALGGADRRRRTRRDDLRPSRGSRAAHGAGRRHLAGRLRHGSRRGRPEARLPGRPGHTGVASSRPGCGPGPVTPTTSGRSRCGSGSR